MRNKIVILLATYNGEKFISSLLDSLLLQSYKEFDLILRDDGSVDNTLKAIDSYVNKLNIRLIPSSERLGSAKSFLELLVKAGNDYECYMFADQDDYWVNDKVERAFYKTVKKNDDTPILYCTGLEVVDKNLAHISFSSKPHVIGLHNALVENIATGCTIALNYAARNLILSNLPRKMTMHDWWFYIVLSAFGRIIYDDYASIKYRQHDGNSVGASLGVVNDFSRRLRRFFSRDKMGAFGIFEQANEFMSCYGNKISDFDKNIIISLISGKKNLNGKIYLVFNSLFVRQKILDTFILRFLFLIGRY